MAKSRRYPSIFWFLILSLVAGSAVGAKNGFKNQSVGQMAEQVLTLRGVLLSLELNRWQSSEGGNGASLPKQITPQDVSAVLVEKVVALEAGTYDLSEVDSALVKKESDKLWGQLQGKELQKRFEYSRDEVVAGIKEKIIYQRFIEFKGQSMRSIVTDAEAKSYFDKNRMKFGNVAFESYKSQVVSFLERQQSQERMRSWFEILKRKYQVRLLIKEPVEL